MANPKVRPIPSNTRQRTRAFDVNTHSVEAEQCTLGGLMLDNSKRKEIHRDLVAEDFHLPEHREIYRTISALADRGAPFDWVTIAATVEAIPGFTAEEMRQLIGRFAHGTPSAANTVAYAGIVLHRSLLRRYVQAQAAGEPRQAADLLEQAEALEANGFRPVSERYRQVFASAGEMCKNIKGPDWVLKGIYEANTLAQVFGAPGSGKSALVLAQACHVAAGMPWNGRRVKQGPVIYICGEGHEGVKRRIKAWCIVHKVDPETLPLYVTKAPVALFDPKAAQAIGDTIEDLSQAIGERPVMVVVDTLARNNGGDENSTKEMTQVVNNMDVQLKARFQAALVVLHHCGHGDKTRGRGSIALPGAIDWEYRVTKDEDNIVAVEPGKVKDGTPPPTLHFKFTPVDLGICDEDGDPVDSFVLEATDPPDPPEPPVNRKMGQSQAAMLKALRELYDRQRANLCDRPDAIPRVFINDWREACIQAGACTKAHFSKTAKRLELRGLICMEHPFVYLEGE